VSSSIDQMAETAFRCKAPAPSLSFKREYLSKISIIIIMKAKITVTLYIKNVTGALYTVNYNESTLSVSVNAAWNSVVLTAQRNACSEDATLTEEGRAFQACELNILSDA